MYSQVKVLFKLTCQLELFIYDLVKSNIFIYAENKRLFKKWVAATSLVKIFKLLPPECSQTSWCYTRLINKKENDNVN